MKTLTLCLLGAFTLIGAYGEAHARVVTVVSDPADYGPYCREYRQSITIANETQVGYGIACLQPDGTWEVVSDSPDETFHYVYRDERVYFTPPRPYASVVIRDRHSYVPNKRRDFHNRRDWREWDDPRRHR